MTRHRRMLQRWACVVWLNGERHRFLVPLHHHIYRDGEDYVIGSAQTRCESWRYPADKVASVRLKDSDSWLI